MQQYGYVSESFAIFKGKIISPAEYSDGSTKMRGKIVKLDDEAEYRLRYLTRYNFIIAPHDSPLNVEPQEEMRQEALLNEILKNESAVSKMVEIAKTSRHIKHRSNKYLD